MSSVYTTPLESFEPRGRAFMDVHPQDDGTDDDNLASSILSSVPKLSSKSSASSVINANHDETWSIRQVPSGEEELFSRGKCLYWTRNSMIVKSFNFTEKITGAFWATFNNKDHVCIALNSGLSIFDRTGQHMQIPLPFVCYDMFSTKLGIVIQRFSDSLDESTLPILFALTDPNQEISPIIFRHPAKELTYSMSPSISIVACHSQLPLCLMYNEDACQHSIWRVRPTTNEEVDEFQRLNEQSTIYTHDQSYSFRDGSLSKSSKQKSSLMQQSNASSTSTINFSPKMDLRSKHSVLGNLAASRLGLGAGQLTAPDSNATTIKSFNSNSRSHHSISTPNKNRIINYLRDNIEEPILPQITFEQIWLENSNSSPKGTNFFSTIDLAGEEYLVIVISSSSQIKIMKCDISKHLDDVKFVKTSTIEASEAMPVPSLKMMLVADVNKTLALYSGMEKITTITVPQPPQSGPRIGAASSPSTHLKGPADMTPIHMSSARKRSSLGDRSSMGSDLSFQQMFQALSPVPHLSRLEPKISTPVVLSDMRKIEAVIGRTVYLQTSCQQLVKFEIPSICQTEYVQRLLNSIKTLAPRELGLSILTKWYQARRAATQADLMKASCEMDLFRNWFLGCIGITNISFTGGFSSFDSLGKSMNSPTKKSRRARDSENNLMIANLHTLFYAMHLVFEEMLLMKLNYDMAYSLAELLIVIACLLNLENYQDYYWLKFPQLQKNYGQLKASLELLIPKLGSLHVPSSFRTCPPSVMGFISKIVESSRANTIYKGDVLEPFPYVAAVTEQIRIIISLFCEMYNINRSEGTVAISTNSIYRRTNILTSCPFRSEEANQKVVELLVEYGKDRSYLSSLPEGINLYLWDAILSCRESPLNNWSDSCFKLVGRMDLVNLVKGHSSVKKLCNLAKDNEDETLKLIFPDDIRVSEAYRMLASDSPVEFNVTQRQGATEEESREETHRHLYLLNIRTMAMPLGRGAICLRTYSPVIGESCEAPVLELCGRSLSEDRLIEYTHDVSVYPWPFFHNGVAAGLTICASTASNIIDSTWINYNRPRGNQPHGADIRDRDVTTANTINQHAGFLFALGLNGHLEKLSLMALHDYLCQSNDLTKLAILLGMSAAKRGSKDNNIIKVLSIHVDALLPPNSTELDVPAPVHAASIIGVGLLYQSSGDSHISKVLLEEIGRLPGPETNSHVDRESYSLSAGLAFGLVNLCKGDSTTISSSDQLRLYMLGGKRKPLTANQKERYFKQDCHRGEEEYINTHITSPGGTLGLGLMYHRSGNKSVAEWMRPPDTQTLLEYVRPDFLILRMLSYGLIMWDEIEPTEKWINNLIPEIVSTHAFQKDASPATEKVSTATNTDYELISQAYCNIVAGCCMSIALKYAGTANRGAYTTIYKHTKMLIALTNKPTLAEQAGRPCVESCINVLVTSLAVVMAGTGDIGVMRVCRYLRSRLTQSCVFYGSYMAVNMALGLLFLGACRYSLSTSPESIGALVCALYPIYPNHSSDNRYHLQALRHLYVLAVEPRLLVPRDILTDKPLYAKVKITLNNSELLEMQAPCLMPEVNSIRTVCIDDDRYWRIEINDKNTLIRCLIQDQGCLSVKQKAHTSDDMLVKNIETHVLQNMKQGVMKSRKSSALDACVREDRVEQYAALNILLTRSHSIDLTYRSLILEQIRLACALSSSELIDKINLLKPIIGDFDRELKKEDIEASWMKYVSKQSDWTNTQAAVAHFVVLHDLKVSVDIDEDLLQALQDE